MTRLAFALMLLFLSNVTPVNAWPVPGKAIDRVLLAAADVIAIVEPIAIENDRYEGSIAVPPQHEGKLAGAITTFRVLAVVKGYDLVGAWDWSDKKTIGVKHLRIVGESRVDRVFLPDFSKYIADAKQTEGGIIASQFLVALKRMNDGSYEFLGPRSVKMITDFPRSQVPGESPVIQGSEDAEP